MGLFHDGKGSATVDSGIAIIEIDLHSQLKTYQGIVGVIKQFAIKMTAGGPPGGGSYEVQVFSRPIADLTEYNAYDESSEYSKIKTIDINSSDNWAWSLPTNMAVPYRNSVDAQSTPEDVAKIWVGIVPDTPVGDEEFDVFLEFENRGRTGY